MAHAYNRSDPGVMVTARTRCRQTVELLQGKALSERDDLSAEAQAGEAAIDEQIFGVRRVLNGKDEAELTTVVTVCGIQASA
jgi:hypothetical protein